MVCKINQNSKKQKNVLFKPVALCQWGYKFKAESSGKFKHILLGLYLHVTSAVTCLGVFRGRDVLMCGQIFVRYTAIVEPTVEIVVSYDPPSTFTLSPPSYRAASPLSLTCEVQGMQDYSAVFYQWTYPHYVTSLQNTGSGDTISTPYLHSRDTGVYTCMVFGIASSASITVNVVGK